MKTHEAEPEPRIGLKLEIKGDDHYATMGVVLGLKPYVLVQLDGDEDGFDFIVEAGGHEFDGAAGVAEFLGAVQEFLTEGTPVAQDGGQADG